MADVEARTVFRAIDLLLRVGTTSGVSDGQMLARFADRRDEAAEAAFAALVERHGPMVLRACRRALNDPHDAQDAFQATFLVLMRKADSLRDRDSIAAWLYGVARRVAAHAKAAEARRKVVEQAVRRDPAIMAVSNPNGHDSDLWDEVDRLPDAQRTAVVLCYLEGLTHEQAARRLGWPVGTVHSRLARARERLRGRLERRGVAPSPLAPPAWLFGLTRVQVSSDLIHSTVRAAFAVPNKVGAGLISPSAAALTEEVLRTMFIAKLKTVAAGVVAAGALITGAVVYGYQTPVGAPGDLAQSAPPRMLATPTRDFEDHKREVRRVIAEQIAALVQQAQQFQEQGDLARAQDVLDDIVKLTRHWAGLLAEPVGRPALKPAEATPVRQPAHGRPLDTERRLDEVERKLERILKVLEGPSPTSSQPK